MAFQKLPLWENHTPLVLMWHVDQLRPFVDLLTPWLPGCLTDRMQLAIASAARSIVVPSSPEKVFTMPGPRTVTASQSGTAKAIPG
jgi:hypothetical protein